MKNFLVIGLLAFSIPAFAQTTSHRDDVKSVDAILTAVYDVISGEKNAEMDWERFRNLFAPDARLIPTFRNREGKIVHRSQTLAEYETSFKKMMSQHGFYERELFSKREEYGNIVHVFSTYETRDEKNGPVTARGINSIQLLKTDDRYYVLTILWTNENKDNPLPATYLKK